MKVTAKYENLTGNEVKIVDIPYFNEDDGNTYTRLGIQIGDYISLDLVAPEERDVLEIFTDYLNRLKELDKIQLDILCEKFIEVYWTDFNKEDVINVFNT